MDNHFTRSKQTLIDSVPNYNTRLQSRLRERASSQFNVPEKPFVSHQYFTRSTHHLTHDISQELKNNFST
mgnify:FL=1